MAINTALLIAAPILQDYFSDNATDAAMSAGVITCFQDNSRTTLKNWYYQTGSPGNYTYIQLPNPLTLSAAGTITDAMGNDTIPFWYPYSEVDNITPQPYYVTVDNSNGQRQFTRQNFPFVAPANTSGLATFRNLIVNNVFWRNVGTQTLTGVTKGTLAPSQHDGLADMSDIQFIKDAAGSTDVATFTPFTNLNRLANDATPEYYLNMSCNSTGTSETVKYIQIPICLHVDNLSGYSGASVTLWTQNPTGAANNTLTISLLQFQGTGGTSPTATTLITINPSSTWQKTVVNFKFPIATLPPTGANDNGWFLQIGFPVGVPYNMNIAKPSVYLSSTTPIDDFDTYEYVSGTIDAPRTGDVRTSLNVFYPFGWVPMNNGTIGNASSGATSRANADTWPLFNLMWKAFQGFNNATQNLLAQMVNSSGMNVSYGASAIADFNANNAIALTQTVGNVILGTVPLTAQTAAFSTTFTASNSAGALQLTTSNSINSFIGMPINFINVGGALPGGLISSFVYYVASFTGGNTLLLSNSFANALAGNFLSFVSSGSGTNTLFQGYSNSVEGEYQHTQLLREVGPIQTSTADTTGARVHVGSGTGGPPTNTAVAAGGQVPFNVTQPGVFLNMYMKL